MSTGFECHIVERTAGEWYYVLQDGDCPVGAWDWREYATAYGPFPTEDVAFEHLRQNHANPGGYSTYSLADGQGDADEVLQRLCEKAVSGQQRVRLRW